ncbi:MAG: ADP-ribosylation factor-like protein [Candidatus Korarchaeota archaeon]
MRKDKDGRLHLKLVLSGPTLAGKTTMVHWLYNNLEGFNKGRLESLEDEYGRTLYFDYTPFALEKIVFDIYTQAGQIRHIHQREIVLKGADGVLLVVDSSREALEANKEIVREVKEYLARHPDIPVVVAYNKRDMPNIYPVEFLRDTLELQNFPSFETVATTGKGCRAAFGALMKAMLEKALE